MLTFENNFYQLDRILTHYYLSREFNGDTVLRFIDASAENIATAVEKNKEQALQNLLTVCRHDAKAVYQSGYTRQPRTHEATGCLPYLILACHAASKASENDGSRDFRHCTQALLQDETIQNFTGLNILWKLLKKWTEENIKDFISVELANPCGHRTIIGRTQDMSFPAWRDESKLQQALSFHENADESTLEWQLTQYTPSSLTLTQGCSTLLHEYKELTRRGVTERRATRFWNWILSLGNQRRHISNVVSCRTDNILILEDTPDGWLLGSEETMLPIESVLQESVDFARYNVEKYLAFGLVFFEESGLGSYTATLNPEECRRGALLYDGARHALYAPENGFPVLPIQSSSWKLILDLDYAAFDAILDAMRNNDAFSILRGCVPFILHGGVKRYSRILAIPELAPRILCLRDGVIHFMHDSIRSARLSCRSGDVLRIPEELLRKGRISVRYVGALGKERICVNKNFDVFECAPPLERLQKHRDYELEIPEAEQRSQTVNLRSPLLHDNNETIASLPLEEALYLAGGSGWHTVEICELCDTLFPDTPELSWMFLRSLMEGGWLTPVWGKRWGYKLHRLTPASLIKLPTGVLLWGARPKWICDKFKYVARSIGATIRCTRFGPLAPANFLAEGADLDIMAENLQYCAIKGCTPHVLQPLPVPLPEWMQADARYKERKTWDWKTCRLYSQNDTPTKCGVSLVQLHVPDAPRYHTLYQVRKNEKKLLTTPVYAAAVLYAYKLARQPLFHQTKDGIIPLHANAFLPLPLVQELAQWNTLCPGPVQRDGTWRYVYPFTKEQQSFVVAQLGESLFVGQNAPSTTPVIYRHKPYGRFLYTR